MFLLIYLLIINIFAFVLYAIDKLNAIKGRWRIRVTTLLGVAFIGGSAGALLAMYTFRHKTRKAIFTVGVPLMLVVQIIVIFFIIKS